MHSWFHSPYALSLPSEMCECSQVPESHQLLVLHTFLVVSSYLFYGHHINLAIFPLSIDTWLSSLVRCPMHLLQIFCWCLSFLWCPAITCALCFAPICPYFTNWCYLLTPGIRWISIFGWRILLEGSTGDWDHLEKFGGQAFQRRASSLWWLSWWIQTRWGIKQPKFRFSQFWSLENQNLIEPKLRLTKTMFFL